MKVLNIIKTFFSKNTGWKIGSLFIAIILWFVVMNTLNPAETKTFSVPVSIVNEHVLNESGYAVLNTQDITSTRVEIKVKATRAALDSLPKQNDGGAVQAVIDFSQFDTSRIISTPQSLVININPKIENGFLYTYEVASLSPNSINVLFDKVKEKEVKLTTNFSGELEEGYVASIKQISADKVTVFGPESEFDKLGSVIADISLKDKSEDFTAELKPSVFNTNGELLPNFTVQPSDITAQVSISYTRNLEIMKPETTGKLSSELVLKAIDWNPKVLELTGDKEILDSLEPIKLTAIELDKLVGSDIRTYEVSQFINDPRISTKSTTPRVITVTIELAGKDGKNITLDAEDIKVTGLSSGLKALMPSQVVFTVFGDQNALSGITNSSFKASVDLSSYSEGAVEVPLNITLPEGLEIRGETKVYVYITKAADNSLSHDTELTELTETETEVTTQTAVTEEPVTEHVTEEPVTEEPETAAATEESSEAPAE
ncbi:MAG: hypothetical protein IKS17_02080 [Firmicutes bacterium]|nr:hypothetical protein [Bacillota bacterium]